MSGDELERAVRESLASQAAVPPVLRADLAGVAIRRAGRSQRRRTLSGVTLAALATVLASAGVTRFTQEPTPPDAPVVVLGDPYPTTSASAPVASPGVHPGLPADVDLVLGDVLATAAGTRVTLTGVRPVDRVQRFRDAEGWLVIGAPTTAGRSLWAVRPNSPPQVLLSGADEIVLSQDSRQVAWREGTKLGKGGILDRRVVAVVRRPAPAGAVPVGFTGDQVVIRLDPDLPGLALWHPPTGKLSTGTDRTTTHVYGTRPDGLVVAQVSTGTPRRPCVALLDPKRYLAPERTICGAVLGTDGHGAVSPDGRLLLANGRDSALLVDLETVVNARPAGPPVTGAVAWTDDTAVHVSGGRTLVRVEAAAVQADRNASAGPLAGLDGASRALPVVGNGS
ncbi:hypothetical protein [Micromonospora endolithica]|nr:hypothetical protein [Micromonospora endolithica]TWJ24153.1 hypothetical protein JD76_04301 [Micromonospora endolithica]